jgi:tetrahydromethanopterin S-methyltransferase subunit G
MALTDEDKTWISSTVAELLRPTNSRLDAIDHRLDAIDHRLDAIDHRLDAIDHRLDAIDHRLDAIDRRLDSVDARFDRQDEFILQFRAEVLRRFDIIDHRLDFLASSFNKLDMQVPPLNRAIVDFGVLAGQFAREQMFTKERDADIATRIARLEDQLSKLNPAA